MRKEKHCAICGDRLNKKVGYKQFGNLYICNICLDRKKVH